MNVVVTGATGQVGRAVLEALPKQDAVGFSRLELDLCDFAYTRETLWRVRPDVVVNPAAFTRVDDCEIEPERAFWVNSFAVRNLAQVCADLNCILVHLSTDYVFDGTKESSYTEDDLPNPLSVYGTSKLVGEYFVRNLVPRHYIVRTSGVYGRGASDHRRGNFVDTMLRLADSGQPIRVVTDQVLTPTAATDVARKIAELVESDRFGLYHVTNAGQCTWFEFATAIFRLAGLSPRLEATTSEALARRARRPRFSVLAHTRLLNLGLQDLPPWEDALARYLQGQGRLVAAPGKFPAR